MSEQNQQQSKALKSTFIAIATVSCILLLFYAPVLIWSPPWSHNGYYIPASKGENQAELKKWIFFWEGQYTEFGPDFLGNFNAETLTFTLKTKQRWVSAQVKTWSIGDVSAIGFKDNKMYFNEGTKFLGTGLIDYDLFPDVSDKVSNPITICKLKYQEWSNK